MPTVTRYGIAGTGYYVQSGSGAYTDQPYSGHGYYKAPTDYRAWWRHDINIPSDAIVTAASLVTSIGTNMTPGNATWYFGDTNGAGVGVIGWLYQGGWATSFAVALARVSAYKTGSIWINVYNSLNDSGSATNAYVTFNATSTYLQVTYNLPPPAPGPFTNPTAGQVITGGSVLVQWPSVTDPDGDAVNYWLQYWNPVTAAWTTIVGGGSGGRHTTNSYLWDVSAFESRNDYQLRVYSTDNIGGESGWTTGPAFTIQNHVIKAGSDSLTLAVADATVAPIPVTVDTADPLNLSVAEVQESFLTSAATDDLTLGADDASSILVSLNRSDDLGVAAADATPNGIELFTSGTDAVTVAVAEGAGGVVVAMTGTDDLVVGVTDDTGAAPSFVQISTNDDATLSLDETVSSTAVTLSRADDLTIAADDQRDLLVIPADRSDTLVVGLADATVQPMQVNLDLQDDLNLSVDENRDIFVSVARTDELGLSLAEQAAIVVPRTGSDTFILSVDESFPVSLEFTTDDDGVGIIFDEESGLYRVYESGPPPDEILYAATAPFTRVVRRVDIYESDGETPFMLNAPFLDGNVNCDMGRSERRIFDLQLQNINGTLTIYPEGFWYDKVVKIYRGIETAEIMYLRQLGEFMIDSASEPNFPATLSVSGRDYTKKLLTSKFPAATAFQENVPIENVIHTIAVNAGITKFRLPLTGKSTQRQFFFDRQVERWKAIEEIAHAYGYDVYFTHDGYLTMTEQVDPTTGQPDYVFQTGKDFGNLAAYEKRTADARMYNHVVVSGEASDTIPVWVEVKNEVPGHPTSVAKIGERSYFFTSSFITTTQQAQDVAEKFLKIHALEQFEANVESIVIPWLEVGTVVDFIDPNPADGDPTRYLFSDCSIPLGLATMRSGLKRVTVVT